MASQPNGGFYRARTKKEQSIYDMDLKSSCQENYYEKGIKRAWKYLFVFTNENLIK